MEDILSKILEDRELLQPKDIPALEIDATSKAKFLDPFLPDITEIPNWTLWEYHKDGSVTDQKKTIELYEHAVQFFWETRFFIKEAYRDDHGDTSHKIYVFRKILMLKSAFISWLSLWDKIDNMYGENFPKSSKCFEKYGKNTEGENISWIGKTTSFRQFANDIKHNQDFLSEIQISFRTSFQSTTSQQDGAEYTIEKCEPYDLSLVSRFYYGECLLKLLIAFEELVKVMNELARKKP